MSPDERVALLEARLGIGPGDRALLLTALTHTSYANEHPGEGGAHNERLEFLGDAVVDLAISHRLMERFPQAAEGELSKLRALLVNEDGLARVARSIGLGGLLLLGRGEERSGGRDRSSVLADALEAVIGAVYLAGGLPKVMELVDRHFGEGLAGVAESRDGLDYKTLFKEAQERRLKVSPTYRVVSVSGPPHDKTFEVEVVIGEEAYARAAGKSKKEAEQAAARLALERLSGSGQEPGKS